MCELFFWFESTYQKFCSISLLSTFMGYLPDRNQRGMAGTKRKLVALELAYPLKTRGRRQALLVQKWEQFLPTHSGPQRGRSWKGDPQPRLKNDVCTRGEHFQLKCFVIQLLQAHPKPRGSRWMGSLGILGPECCYLLRSLSVLSFFSLCCLPLQQEDPLCVPGLSDFPLGRDLREKHSPFTGRSGHTLLQMHLLPTICFPDRTLGLCTTSGCSLSEEIMQTL